MAEPDDERILILASVGRDGRMLSEALAGAGFIANTCGSVSALVQEVRRGAAAIIATEESFADPDRPRLVRALQEQPAWSDMPIIVLTSADRGAELADIVVREFAELGNVTLLERPLRVMTLVTTVQAAARARHRQYQVRDDVGEREALEGQLRAWAGELEVANRAKDEFLAMLSHELRNPLHAIASASSILDHARSDSTEAKRAREVIRRQTQHLRNIVEDLLDLGRITTGKIHLHRRPVDLAALVQRVINGYAIDPEARTHGFVVDASPVWVNGDEARLEQIAVNLIGNARKYTPPGGTIHVTVGPDAERARVRVADTGIGIPHDRLPRIFDLFFQGEQTLDRHHGGLGIGLTLVQRLVTLHDGQITAQSEGINRGSTFTVWMPRVSPVDTASSTRDWPRTARRVLIVEDNADSRDMLRVALELEGHEVFVAADGAQGLETARGVHPDAVLLDIGLPGADGYEVARQFRHIAGGDAILLVALTGYGQEEDHRRSRQAGFDFHLVKPVDPLTVAEILAGGGSASDGGGGAGSSDGAA